MAPPGDRRAWFAISGAYDVVALVIVGILVAVWG
jgi:hypothetical protein